jgi:myo-inositol 2-dehydrogenase/D-chiro-inositol 1-dehydrogenase
MSRNLYDTEPAGPLSRRAFLRRAAVATTVIVAGPMIVPGRVLGLDGGVAPSNRIAIGFIGTGRQTLNANIPAFLTQPDAQVVSVCDVDSWRLNVARTKVEDHYARDTRSGSFKGCATTGDWRDVIARKDIDAVMIGTPDHWHMVMALAALRAGKDVSCEKPLTRDIATGRKLVETVVKHGRVFCTDGEFRSYGSCRRAAQLVRNGKIGKLQRMITGMPKDDTLGAQPDIPVPEELNYEMWLGPAPLAPYAGKRVHPRHETKGRPGWIAIRDYADGMIANWGAHLNDIAMWANNSEHTGPVEIEATGTFPPTGNLWDVIQEFEAHYLFANGVRLTCKSDRPYIRFEGTEGWIQIDFPLHLEMEPDSLLSWEPGPNDVRLPSMKNEKRDFLDAVKSRKQPQYDAEGGHRTAVLSHLALASIELGRKLKWDPVKETVLGDDQANDHLEPKPLRAPWTL